MGSIGAPELLIILVVILVLFGGAKLPKLARSLGEAQKEFKHATDHLDGGDDAPSRSEAEIKEAELRVREAELRAREAELRAREQVSGDDSR